MLQYYPPSRNVQHAFARNLSGPGGWITVTVPAAFGKGYTPVPNAGPGQCHLPPRGGPLGSVSPGGAMTDAYTRNLSVVLVFQPFYVVDGCGPPEASAAAP